MIDALRALAVLAVTAFLLQHHLPAALRGVAAYGWLGTGLLLMISGFLIGSANWGRTPARFLRNRAVRLLPALPLAVPALWLGAGWDIARAELLFYAFFTLLLWRGLTRRRAVRFGYGWLIAAVLAMTGDPGIVRTVVQPEVAGFFAGGLAFALIRRFGPDITLVGLAAVAYVLSLHFTIGRTTHQIAAGLAVTACFGLLATVTAGQGKKRQNAAARLIYPFSLLAPAAGWLMTQVPSSAHPLVIVPAGLLVVAGLTHLLVERPAAQAFGEPTEIGPNTQRHGDEAVPGFGPDCVDHMKQSL